MSLHYTAWRLLIAFMYSYEVVEVKLERIYHLFKFIWETICGKLFELFVLIQSENYFTRIQKKKRVEIQMLKYILFLMQKSFKIID